MGQCGRTVEQLSFKLRLPALCVEEAGVRPFAILSGSVENCTLRMLDLGSTIQGGGVLVLT